VVQAVQAVAVVGQLDRRRVRACFEQRFSASAMANAYVEQYARLIGGGGVLRRQDRHFREVA